MSHEKNTLGYRIELNIGVGLGFHLKLNKLTAYYYYLNLIIKYPLIWANDLLVVCHCIEPLRNSFHKILFHQQSLKFWNTQAIAGNDIKTLPYQKKIFFSGNA